MTGTLEPTASRHDDGFSSDESPVVLLDPDPVIRAVNPSAERAVGRAAEDLVSRHVFEAFPANPGEPDGATGRAVMADCFRSVLRDGRPRDVVLLRYDVPDATDPGRFHRRVWAPVVHPVRRDGVLTGLACRATLLPLPDDVLHLLSPVLEMWRDAAASADRATRRVSDVAARALREYAARAAEVEQLGEALESRATIDQAKGILMAQQGCGPEEAFRMLVKLSNDTNVRLADVAGALVYQVRGAG